VVNRDLECVEAAIVFCGAALGCTIFTPCFQEHFESAARMPGLSSETTSTATGRKRRVSSSQLTSTLRAGSRLNAFEHCRVWTMTPLPRLMNATSRRQELDYSIWQSVRRYRLACTRTPPTERLDSAVAGARFGTRGGQGCPTSTSADCNWG